MDQLDSPFLEHEPFARPALGEAPINLAALESESPFVTGEEPSAIRIFELEEEDRAQQPCTGIIGVDDRVPVRQAWDVPYRWICQISARRRRGGTLMKFGPVGTGVLISPRFVLTAAHLLRNSEQDQRGLWVDTEAEYLVVTPARNDHDPGGVEKPFGEFEARAWHVCPKYAPRSADAWKYDFAVIELKEPAGAKRASVLNNSLLCFWGSRECGDNTELQVLAPRELAAARAYTAGYPEDLGGGIRPYSTSGMLSGIDVRGRAEIMNYDADGCPGQSGSPIWIERDSKRYLVGIFTKVGTGYDATTGLVSLNNAVRITQDVFSQVSSWLESVLETPWLQEADAESVVAEHDVPRSTSATRSVAVGERVELDLSQTPFAANLAQVRWSIPGRVVAGYAGTTHEAKLVELAAADLEHPHISFYWVDAGTGRAVRARIRDSSGGEHEFVANFDVEGPRLNSFTGTPGATRIFNEHGTMGMQFGKPRDVPGVLWKWNITMPAHRAGFVKDLQTVVVSRSRVQRLRPGGSATTSLVWRHPSNTRSHAQFDGDADKQVAYSQGLMDDKIEADQTFDTSRGLEDSPHTGLAKLDKTVSVDDHFTYWIMFRPDVANAIWVPVAKATWFWNATADHHGDGTWTLRKTPDMKPAVEMSTLEFPLYESNGSENTWQGSDTAVPSHELEVEELPPTPGYEDTEVEVEAYDAPLDEATFEAQLPTAPWAAAIEPFPPAPTLAFRVDEPGMLAAFAPVTTSSVRHLCAAVVDLTGDPSIPAYAGMNDEEMVFSGSMNKVCAMYVAFALRAQVQAFVDAAAANGVSVVPPDITGEIDKAWRPKLHALFPSRPAKSFINNQDITFPKLDEIFEFSPSGKVEFARATPAISDADLDRAGEFGKPPGKFQDWMRLMMRWSNNTAASYCILALGYFYINGALGETGFFDSSTNNGLWLSADYQKHDWVSTSAEKNANVAGQPLTARWASAQGRRKSNITATAAQAARLMTAIAQGRLVDATSSQEMQTLMQSAIACVQGGTCGIGSYVKDALAGAHRAFTSLAAKKGYGDDSFSHECGIVERTVDGKHLRYAVVGLGSAPSQDRRDLSELFVRLDSAIVTRNS